MMTKWVLLACITLCMGLVACSKRPDNESAKLNIPLCKAQCVKRLNACNQVCDNNCAHCMGPAYVATAQHYARFLDQQKVQGGLIARDLKSYHDPLQCLKSTCHCQVDYYQCAEACTGTIHKRLQSPVTCC